VSCGLRRIAGGAAAVLVTAILAGCVSTTTGRGDIATWYDRSFMVTATRDGTLPVVVHGRPAADLDAAATAQLVAANARLPGWLPQARLVPGTPDRRYRMVLIFNPARLGLAKLNACGPLDELATNPPQARIQLVGAVCDGRDAGTTSQGTVDAGGNAADAVVRLTRQMITELLPRENPVHRANVKTGGP